MVGIIERIVSRINKRKREIGKEKGEKIDASRYNEAYNEIVTQELTQYLEGRKKNRVRSLLVHFRYGEDWRTERRRRNRKRIMVSIHKSNAELRVQKQ